MTRPSDVAIIGAGPYGLSLAAHLRGHTEFRIFGRAMATWRSRMPAGMALKSEGFASNLYDPAGSFTLAHYCAQTAVPYADVGLPVPLAVFAAYGLAFQKKFVPDLEPQDVVALTRHADGFCLQLADGSRCLARRVVVAAGIGSFAYVPPVLRGLPAALVSHSSDHPDVARFAGCDVTVVGAGSSALDLAALLRAAGAAVRLVARTPALAFHPPPQHPRRWWQRLRAPRSGLGTGWKSRLYSDLPLLFRHLPARLRHHVVATHLGPAPCWFVADQVIGQVEMVLGRTIARAAAADGRVQLELSGGAEIRTEHVIAATGFRVDLARLDFLAAGLRRQIRTSGRTPVLSSDFESSVPGLYFVGATAADCFGPLLRFACGAAFCARRLSRHLGGRTPDGGPP